MEYCKALDGLPRIVNILFAIFLPILHVIYAIIADVTNKNTIALVLDILTFVLGGVIYWVMDIVWVITKHQVFAWSYLVK